MDLARDVRNLLSNLNFKPSKNARADLQNGEVDPRLVAVLLALVEKHQIEVSVIKTGHPMGPTTPSGLPNAHYYGRVADIVSIDGKPVAGNGADPDLLDIGRILRDIPLEARPDEIMGPAEWQHALSYPRSAGFISDVFHNEIHADHLHIGFRSESGTVNRE